MGVPGLFSFLVRRYPFIVVKTLSEEEGLEALGVDELYIGVCALHLALSASNAPPDWNQVVHNCTHVNASLAAKPEAEQFREMHAYALRLMRLLGPRSLLMLAVDGVAPAAKIAQQRTRRYTSALRRSESARHRDSAVRELSAGDPQVAEELDRATQLPFDSNVITPGTPFMGRMEVALNAWLCERLASDPSFAELEVVWSPSTDPGEGEHKIMHLLRRRRQLPGFLPSATRAVVGQDADLILLGLCTHEPNALIIREQLIQGGGHSPAGEPHPLDVVSIAALREALRWEFASLLGGEPKEEASSSEDSGSDDQAAAPKPGGKNKAFDLERIIDDLVALSCLLGNDFLPSVPSLDIHGQPSGMEAVWTAYLKSLPRHGYITHRGQVLDPARGLAGLLRTLAEGELDRLQFNMATLEKRARNAARRAAAEAAAEAADAEEDAPGAADWETEAVLIGARHSARPTTQQGEDAPPVSIDKLADEVRRRVEERLEASFAPVCVDRLRMGTIGDRERYYAKHWPEAFPADCKGGKEADALAALAASVSQDWLAGLGWVSAYYFHGAGEASGAPWRWAYPHAAAPLLRDLVAHAEAARRLLPKASAPPKATLHAPKKVAPVSVAERRRMRARRKAQVRGEAASHPQEVDEAALAAHAEWLSLPDGPVPVELQLLAVIPPESAPACYPPRCTRLLQAAPHTTRLADAFPTTDQTAALVQRGARFAWQASVRVPPVCFAFLWAALEEEEEEEEEEEAAAPTTVLLVNHLRHPDAAFMLVGVQGEPAAGGAALLRPEGAVIESPHPDLACVPLDLQSAALPFGGALLPGAREPPRLVNRAVWRDAKVGATRWRQGKKPAARAAQGTGPPHGAQQSLPAADGGFWPRDWDFSVALRLPPSLLPAGTAPEPAPEEEDSFEEEMDLLLALAYGNG